MYVSGNGSDFFQYSRHTYIFLLTLFWKNDFSLEKYDFMHFERHLAFQNA